MKEDYLINLGHLGMIARLKRLSDPMLYSIREIYTLKGLEIEPNWHFVFLFLKEKKTATMSEMAAAFGLSQPAMVKIITKMKERGYLEIVADSKDNRKRTLKLSSKASQQLPSFEEIWSKGEASVEEMLKGHPDFMSTLETLESSLDEKKFSERVLEK